MRFRSNKVHAKHKRKDFDNIGSEETFTKKHVSQGRDIVKYIPEMEWKAQRCMRLVMLEDLSKSDAKEQATKDWFLECKTFCV